MNNPAHDLAESVLAAHPDGDKRAWGEAFVDAADTPELRDWLHEQQVTAMGRYVAGVQAREQVRRRAERLLTRGVAVATGRPIAPTLSVRSEAGGRQLVLWVDASPAQFVDAVAVEQRVAEGRISANAVRITLAEAIKDDDTLMALPTLAAVCAALEIDPDALGLDDLDEAAS